MHPAQRSSNAEGILSVPITMVRAALRHLVAACPQGSRLLSQNVKKQFLEQSGPLPMAEQLFNGDEATEHLVYFMAMTRSVKHNAHFSTILWRVGVAIL